MSHAVEPLTAETKHTPGPWRWESIPKEFAFREPDKDDTMIVAPNGVCPGTVWQYGEEGLANARLIAAAPDLYAACKAAHEAVKRGGDIDWSLIAVAIAKAEGRL